MKKTIQDCLKERILIIDGAMGTMIQRHKLEEKDYRGDRFADLRVRPGIQGVLKQDLGRIRHGTGRIEGRVAHFVHPVHRRRKCRTAFGHQWRCSAKLTNRHIIQIPVLRRSIVPNA